jgi:hypothetical protein
MLFVVGLVRSAPDMLFVVGLVRRDKKDVTVKGLEALPFEAFATRL